MTATPHILVVDDDPVSARASAAQVRELGYRATACHGWTQALEAFTRLEIDLVLMDAVMPRVDGFRLTRLLRARSAEYVPIVFLTALTDRATRMRCVEAGADDLITKPADPLELRLRLQAMLRIRSLTRALEREQRVLERLASIDALTGIGNRRMFDGGIAYALDRFRQTGSTVSLLLLDIDHFKRVNDEHGHGTGDDLLRLLGDLLTKVTRKQDSPFRYGGEEFAVLSRATRCESAVLVAERIRDAFARTTERLACGMQTLSVGVCGAEQLGPRATPETLLFAADAALYRAKTQGRDRVRRYDSAYDIHEPRAAWQGRPQARSMFQTASVPMPVPVPAGLQRVT